MRASSPSPISGRTRIAALIGQPVGHSMSPAIHNAAFREVGLDWRYVAFNVSPQGLEGALRAVSALGLGGLAVTMPHKARVAQLVDEPSVAVRALAACNTVIPLADGRLAGENTDGDGLVDSLLAGQVEVAGRRVVVLGAGGAGRAIAEAIGRTGAGDVAVVNRTVDNAQVAATLAGPAGRVGDLTDVADADIIINATSVGMGVGGGFALDPQLLRVNHVVVDAVYQPLITPLLGAAAERGCQTFDGLGMLVFQAARQFRLWTGVEAPLATMRAAVTTAMG